MNLHYHDIKPRVRQYFLKPLPSLWLIHRLFFIINWSSIAYVWKQINCYETISISIIYINWTCTIYKIYMYCLYLLVCYVTIKTSIRLWLSWFLAPWTTFNNVYCKCIQGMMCLFISFTNWTKTAISIIINTSYDVIHLHSYTHITRQTKVWIKAGLYML